MSEPQVFERIRDEIALSLAQNYEGNLHDDDRALASYQQIVEPAKHLGSSTQFNALRGIAGIQTKRGKFDDALATLRRVDPAKQQGYWRWQFLILQGDTLLAANRKDEARAAYKFVADDPSADAGLRKHAADKIAAMK